MHIQSSVFLTAALAAGLTASAADFAILSQGRYHHDEYDRAAAELGLTSEHYTIGDKTRVEDLKRFTDSIGKHGLVMVSPLFNFGRGGWYIPEDKWDFAAIRTWIEQGGVLVVPDANYGEILGWVSRVEESAKGLKGAKCTSNPWQVFDYVRNCEPADPLRVFPNVLKQGDTWNHFEEPPAGWRVLARCSEGKPVALTREIGRGQLFVSNLRYMSTAALENFYVNALLRRANLKVKATSLTPPAVGPGRAELTLVEEAPAGSRLFYEIAGSAANAPVARFETAFAGTSATLVYTNVLRGAGRVTFGIVTADGTRTALVSRPVDLPPLFALKPNAYRGILSTKRRVDKVDFRQEIVPLAEDLHGAKLALEVRDEPGNVVWSGEETFAVSNDLPLVRWLPIALPKTLAAGKYVLRGRLTKGETRGQKRIDCTSEAAFEIVAPAPYQVVVDDDNTILVNGKPFFPLGIYHLKGEYDKVASLGFNACQFWAWDDWEDDYGVPRHFSRCNSHGMKCVYEGINNDNVERVAKLRSREPAVLAWYLADEIMEDSRANVEWRNAKFHACDRNKPTFVLSCRPDLYSWQIWLADIFASNGSSSCKEFWITNHLDALDIARSAGENHKAVFDIPSAYPKKAEDLRPWFYAGLSHDVRGVLFYCWNQVGGGPVGEGMHERPDCQLAVSNLLCEAKVLMPGLTSTYRRPFAEGYLHGMACGNMRESGKRFLITINVGREALTSDLEVPELKGVKELRSPFDKKAAPVKLENGRIILPYASLEPRIFTW